MDVLSSRILVRPSDLDRSRRFYRDVLGLAIYREFGPTDDPGVVFFLGPGLLEVSGHRPGPAGQSMMIWIQVRDVHAEHARLAASRSLHHPAARNRAVGLDRDVDPGPRWDPDRPGRGSRRSPSLPRPAIGVNAKMTNYLPQNRALG
jgi:catechol 2,3-dioxygenase-like lactoylglutathione lyase family enzyme